MKVKQGLAVGGLLLALFFVEEVCLADMADALQAFKDARCVMLYPVITNDLGSHTYLAHQQMGLDTDTPNVGIQPGTPFLIKTKTIEFSGAGQAAKIIVERLKESEVKLPNGFKKKVYTFEESDKCKKLWGVVAAH